MVFNLNIETTRLNIDFLKILFIEIFTFYTYLKITNNQIRFNIKQIVDIGCIAMISIMVTYIRFKFDFVISRVCLIFLLSLLGTIKTNNKIGFTILSIAISLSINYSLLFIEIIITFVINSIYAIQSDYINLVIMIIIHTILLYKISKIKRIKEGISFLNRNSKNNDYLDILMLNVSIIISFSSVIIAHPDVNVITSRSLIISICIFAIIMFITIQKSIQLYYKQKLIIKDLEDTKSELENMNEKYKNLEKDYFNLSGEKHTFDHKYKVLEHKLKKLEMKSETAEELDLKDKLDDLSKDIYVVPGNIELVRTEIAKLDDTLNYMKSECDKNDIEMSLQINGNIHHMINKLIPKEDLQILLADHIKDAIIAINHSDNVNRTILVKLGKLDGCYGLYIYDSGVEFEKETLENIGKKPITTHKDEGGTGMGFMNTFETLKKYNASLIINEMGKPSRDNFTKVIMFKFDGKGDFRVESYR